MQPIKKTFIYFDLKTFLYICKVEALPTRKILISLIVKYR